MTVPVLHILRQKDFELQIWCVTMAIAAARTLKAVVQDLTGAIYPSVLAIDVLILCTFCVLGLLIYHNKITRIPLAALTALARAAIALGTATSPIPPGGAFDGM